MKKICFLIFLLTIPTTSSAIGADFYVIDVNPTTIHPGETITMNITLKNLGTEFASYLRATLDPEDISPIQALDSPKKYLSRAEAAETSDEYFGIVRQREELVLQYHIKIDDDAPTGAYQVPLILTWEDSLREEKTQTVYLGIKVEGEPNLIISDINTTPNRVYADEEFTLLITLENTGTGKARAVEAELELPREFTGDKVDFAGTIERDKTATFSYNLKASKQAESKEYNFNLIITYIDEEGAKKRVNRPFQVFVSPFGDVNLEIAGVSTSPSKIYPGTDFTLSVQLENIGTQDAKSVKADLTRIEGFTGEFSSFIGKIEEDDVSSGIFDMRAEKKLKPGTYEFVMKITYTDERGEEHVEEKIFPIFVDEKPRKYQRYGVVGGVIILLLAIYLWRRRVEI
jgi:hypothetical protein